MPEKKNDIFSVFISEKLSVYPVFIKKGKLHIRRVRSSGLNSPNTAGSEPWRNGLSLKPIPAALKIRDSFLKRPS